MIVHSAGQLVRSPSCVLGEEAITESATCTTVSFSESSYLANCTTLKVPVFVLEFVPVASAATLIDIAKF